MDFVCVVTNEAFRPYLTYPIPMGKVLLNKRGKLKKPPKEGPPPSASATAPSPSGEPTVKKVAVKKTRSRKITSSSAARATAAWAFAIRASVVSIPPPEVDVVGGGASAVSKILPPAGKHRSRDSLDFFWLTTRH